MSISLEEFRIAGAVCSLNAHETLIGWGNKIWAEKPLSYPVWYAPDFFLLNPKPYLHFSHTKKLTTEELLILGEEYKIKVPFESIDWSFFEAFFKDFKNLELEKIVTYVQKKAKFSTNALSFLKSCVTYKEAHPSTAIYGFWDQEEGMLGVTPELLLSLEKGNLKSIACAGTAFIEKADFMLKDPKLLKEHQIVIKGLNRALKVFGKVLTGTTEMKSFSNLMHLITPIVVKGVNGNFSDLVAAMHPTPALGAFPKKKGCTALKNYDLCVPRARFGAPFGILEAKDHAVIHVAIRNIQWKKGTITMTAGCGIVEESDLETEKQEVNEKFEAIHEILGIYT